MSAMLAAVGNCFAKANTVRLLLYIMKIVTVLRSSDFDFYARRIKCLIASFRRRHSLCSCRQVVSAAAAAAWARSLLKRNRVQQNVSWLLQLLHWNTFRLVGHWWDYKKRKWSSDDTLHHNQSIETMGDTQTTLASIMFGKMTRPWTNASNETKLISGERNWDEERNKMIHRNQVPLFTYSERDGGTRRNMFGWTMCVLIVLYYVFPKRQLRILWSTGSATCTCIAHMTTWPVYVGTPNQMLNKCWIK